MEKPVCSSGLFNKCKKDCHKLMAHAPRSWPLVRVPIDKLSALKMRWFPKNRPDQKLIGRLVQISFWSDDEDNEYVVDGVFFLPTQQELHLAIKADSFQQARSRSNLLVQRARELNNDWFELDENSTLEWCPHCRDLFKEEEKQCGYCFLKRKSAEAADAEAKLEGLCLVAAAERKRTRTRTRTKRKAPTSSSGVSCQERKTKKKRVATRFEQAPFCDMEPSLSPVLPTLSSGQPEQKVALQEDELHLSSRSPESILGQQHSLSHSPSPEEKPVTLSFSTVPTRPLDPHEPVDPSESIDLDSLMQGNFSGDISFLNGDSFDPLY